MKTNDSAIARLLRRGLSLHRYPRYCSDVCLRLLLPVLLRQRGIETGRGIAWHGWPILTCCAGSTMSIGEACRICSRCADTALGVNHPVVLRTLTIGAVLTIGKGVRMSGTTICAKQRVVIGDRCVIGANATIVDTDFHALDPLVRSSPEDATYARVKPVEIGDDVFIGGGSFILKGTRIGNTAVIGAGSVVTGIVPPGSIYAGNPARQVGVVSPGAEACGRICAPSDPHDKA